MWQFIKWLFITVVIALAVFLVGTVVLLRYEPQNSVTLSIRGDLVRHPLLRTLFNLHDVGDGASDYLNPSTTSILINVYTMPSQGVDEAVFNELASAIQVATGKQVSVNITGEGVLPDDNPISNTLLNTVLGPYSTPESTVSSQAQLDVFVLSTATETPNVLGVTYRENGVALYDATITTLTNPNPQTIEPYELSTLLYEFGHQLGLRDNTQEGCVMNQTPSLAGAPYVNVGSIPVSFCQYELSEIAAEAAALR